MTLKLLAGAVALGLSLGFSVGLLSGGASSAQSAVQLGEAWELNSPNIDNLLEALFNSEQWSRGAEPEEIEEIEEPEPEEVVNERPGVFKHLQLVAILRQPRLAAVLKPVEMPDELAEVMVSSANNAGLFEVELNTVVAEGWAVSGISDTFLQISEENGDEIVEYRLFQWD